MKQRIHRALLLAALLATGTMPAASAGPQTGSGPSRISAAFFGFGAGCFLATAALSWWRDKIYPSTHNQPTQPDSALHNQHEALRQEHNQLRQQVQELANQKLHEKIALLNNVLTTNYTIKTELMEYRRDSAWKNVEVQAQIANLEDRQNQLVHSVSLENVYF